MASELRDAAQRMSAFYDDGDDSSELHS